MFDLLAIAGAISYNMYMVGANIVAMLGLFAAESHLFITSSGDAEEDVLQGDDTSTLETAQSVETIVMAFIFTCLFAYPHFGFIAEVRSRRKRTIEKRLRVAAFECITFYAVP